MGSWTAVRSVTRLEEGSGVATTLVSAIADKRER
jgi:hypothetical protein